METLEKTPRVAICSSLSRTSERLKYFWASPDDQVGVGAARAAHIVAGDDDRLMLVDDEAGAGAGAVRRQIELSTDAGVGVASIAVRVVDARSGCLEL